MSCLFRLRGRVCRLELPAVGESGCKHACSAQEAAEERKLSSVVFEPRSIVCSVCTAVVVKQAAKKWLMGPALGHSAASACILLGRKKHVLCIINATISAWVQWQTPSRPRSSWPSFTTFPSRTAAGWRAPPRAGRRQHRWTPCRSSSRRAMCPTTCMWRSQTFSRSSRQQRAPSCRWLAVQT